MFSKLLGKIFGTKQDRDIKRFTPLVEEINAWADEFRTLTDEQFPEKTAEFRRRFEEGETLDDMLPEAFGLVKEVCQRKVGQKWLVRGHEIKWNMVPYDVQLMGAIGLHEGNIAEMATGEGKTLVAIFPLYLNGLTGKGTHLVTVNEYLANRDMEWMRPIYEFLGLTVDCLQVQESDNERKKMAYLADITYGTTSEFGFDYLRDNMKWRVEDRVQRGYVYAIVDEVDSILIDEARTPLIIAGEVRDSNTEKYTDVLPDVQKLVRAQTRLVGKLVSEAEALLGNPDTEYDAGIKLLQAQRGAPKNKQLIKRQQEQGVKRLIEQVESDYLRDKRMAELDDQLYYTVNEKNRHTEINEIGRELLSPGEQEMFVIPDLGEGLHDIEADDTLSLQEKNARRGELERVYAERSERIHNMHQLLQAYAIFEKDVDYVVQDGKVIIVDTFTGRLMYGRRYSEGLHQAIEAKEGVKIEQETRTVATITIQNYFRMYEKLAGMTGTASTESSEFFQIYKLDVVEVPTNQPVRRIDYEDVVYRTRREKYNSVMDEIEDMNKKGRPVLIGTASVQASETLSRMLAGRGIKHNVLNAKFHQQEAEIVAGAGQTGAVTIATNMAGRGTDIKLGPGVVKCDKCHIHNSEPLNTPTADGLTLKDCMEDVPCGLHIVGTERHEARRIDRQLRGRSGRQGDPGSSRFFLSLEDDLMRLFGGEKIATVMDRFKIPEGEVIEHPLVTRSIGNAQKKVEARNFDMRKHVLEYDNVMNQQREAVYDRRLTALEGGDLRNEVMAMIENIVALKVGLYTDPKTYPEDWDLEGLSTDLARNFHVVFHIPDEEMQNLMVEGLTEAVEEKMVQTYEGKEAGLPSPDLMRRLERFATLHVIDNAWQEHLYEIDRMREGIHLRAYGQLDPLIQYKKEAFSMFEELWDRLDEEILKTIYSAEIAEVEPAPRRLPVNMRMIHQEAPTMTQLPAEPVGAEDDTEVEDDRSERSSERPRQEPVRVEKKLGRNDLCPCGSGKKYKKCHGVGMV
ncbi:MAG: preprotein translocase subunit SecA [candidate division Zixibacteria bacterium]|nr:preprotein translocase subunit SecA [candidate division Zixibacteria bacterium]